MVPPGSQLSKKKSKMMLYTLSAGRPNWPEKEQPTYCRSGTVLGALQTLLTEVSLQVRVKPGTENNIHWGEKAEGIF